MQETHSMKAALPNLRQAPRPARLSGLRSFLTGNIRGVATEPNSYLGNVTAADRAYFEKIGRANDDASGGAGPTGSLAEALWHNGAGHGDQCGRAIPRALAGPGIGHDLLGGREAESSLGNGRSRMAGAVSHNRSAVRRLTMSYPEMSFSVSPVGLAWIRITPAALVPVQPELLGKGVARILSTD